MNMKRKFIGIVGALALTMSMTAGIISAQQVPEGPASDAADISVTVLCGTANTGVSSVSLGTNGNANFNDYDPSSGETSSSTDLKALQVEMDIDPCYTGAWHVDASITDFVSENEDVISGAQFQLPINAASSSLNAYDAENNVITGVVTPSTELVTFGGASAPYTSSHAIAISTGGVSGQMSMDFTGELVGLSAETEPGTYTAKVTVTWSAGAP